MIHDLEENPQKSPIPTSPGKKKVIVISGPTGTGKTHLSLQLARLLGGEIISADSMQVYRKMDIGTAKIKEEERCGIPHHLIDIRNLSDTFNVVDFYEEAIAALDGIHARGNVPIVVGGTGFYIHSLIYGPPQGPPASREIRQKLEDDIEKFGPEPLYDKLCAIDPEYAKKITRGDRQKIIRAFEIMMQTQKPVSEFLLRSQASRSSEFHFRCWFIYQPKQVLYPRIEMRCDEMIGDGFLDEVKEVMGEGIEKNISAAQSIGYRQALEFLQGRQDQKAWDKFVKDFKTASRRYAKRQFTWFRKEPLFRWLDLASLPEEKALEIILHDFESAL